MGYSKRIEQALVAFKKEKGSKKAFLFHNGQAFYFYDHEFCKIDYVNISLSCQKILIEYKQKNGIIDTFFVKVEQEKISITTDNDAVTYDSTSKRVESFKLVLSYGILHDKEGELYLMGFIYVNSKLSSKIYVSYFTEPTITELLELLIFQKVELVQPDLYETNPGIGEVAEKINQESIKALSKVYLKGEHNSAFK